MYSHLQTKCRFLSGIFIFSFAAHSHSSELNFFVGKEYWKYIERDELNQELDREQGSLSDIQLSNLFYLKSNIAVNFKFEHHQGNLKYTGLTQSGQPHSTATRTKSATLYSDIRYYWQQYYFSIGFQYHQWDRNITAANGVGKLDEFYHWIGPNIGVGSRFSLFSAISLDFGTKAAWLNGSMYIDLRNVPENNGRISDFGTPKIPLNNGYELKTYGILRIRLNKNMELLIKHQQGYRSWPRSNDITAHNGNRTITLHEPQSSNYFHSYALGLSYSF